MPRTLNLERTSPTCPARIHGTWRAYRRHGCRCPEITRHVRERKRSWQVAQRVPSTVTPLRGEQQGPIDEMAVSRVLGGERLPLYTVDRRAAIDLLDARGCSAAEIARQVGCAYRTVQRRRAQRRTARHAEPTSAQHAA